MKETVGYKQWETAQKALSNHDQYPDEEKRYTFKDMLCCYRKGSYDMILIIVLAAVVFLLIGISIGQHLN